MRTAEYRWSQVRVGLFAAISGIAFFAAVFYLGVSGTTLGHRARVHAHFDNVFGLVNGSPVEMGGVVVGQIEHIGLPDLQTGLLPVTFAIQRPALERLGGSSEAYASSHALVGQRFVGLTVRKPEEPALEDGGWIRARPSEALETMSGQLLETLRQAGEMIQEGRSVLTSVGHVAEGVEQGHGTLGRLARDEALYNDLSASATHLREYTQEAVNGHGPLATLANDASISEDIRSGVGALAQTARGVRDGRGVIGRLTADDANAQRLDDTIANLDMVSTRLASARGTLGALINDPAVLERMNALLGQVDSLVADVRRNPQRYLKLRAF